SLVTSGTGLVSSAPASPPKPLSPNPSPTENQLDGVCALSSTDVWAVGNYADGSTEKTLVLHWDGTSWTQVPSPNPSSTSNVLTAVRAVSSTNAWAVGYETDDSTGTSHTLVIRWNGTAWSVVPSPNPSSVADTLT